MKKLTIFAITCSVLLLACKNDVEVPVVVPPDEEDPLAVHKVSFGFTVTSDGGRVASDENVTPSKIRLSITDDQGNPLFTDEEMGLTPFGSGYISTPLLLEEGDYLLTAFVVLDETDEIAYAAPLEGSEKAYLVSDPLPLDFTVDADVLNVVDPEVVSVLESDSPESFGYLSMGFSVVPTFQLELLAVNHHDGSEMVTNIDIIGYNSEDEILLETVATTEDDGSIPFVLLNSMDYYEFHVGPPGYHPLTYAFDTEILMAREDPLQFILSSTSDFAMIPVWDGIKGPSVKPQQNAFVFMPLNGCNNSLLVDFGGITPGSFSMDIYGSSVNGGFFEEVDNFFIDFLPGDNNDGGIYRLDLIGNIGSMTDVCQLPQYQAIDDLQLNITVFINSSGNEISIGGIWDNATQQWDGPAGQYVFNNNLEVPLVFQEEYDLNTL